MSQTPPGGQVVCKEQAIHRLIVSLFNCESHLIIRWDLEFDKNDEVELLLPSSLRP